MALTTAWEGHGHPIASPWLAQRYLVDIPWASSVCPMGSRGLLMGSPWVAHGHPVSRSWAGLWLETVGEPWVVHGKPTGGP